MPGAHYIGRRKAVIVAQVFPDRYWTTTVWHRACGKASYGVRKGKRRDFYGSRGRKEAFAYARKFLHGKRLKPGYVLPAQIGHDWCKAR